MELKEFTLDQIKLWKLSSSQLKMQIEVELKRAEKLQQSLKEAELSLQKAKESAIPFYQSQLQTFKSMIGKGAALQSDESLIQALISLRHQNILLQGRIKQTKEQTEKIQSEINKVSSADRRDKYARVMENLSGQQADIRQTWDSNDVLKIDDVAIERNISYDEAKDIVEQGLQEGEVETEDV